ncbi:unnamed protein product [Coregonus sp. 'balchen']|nr:unnamed protein product [Coregonus sp. 'balchen']
MAYSLWIALVLLPVLVHSQSGREWADNEPRILCTSHLSLLSPNTLTCHLDDDNEDDEIEDVKAMTLCYSESSDEQRCLTENGNNVTFTDLATLPLPWVVNVTFLWSSNQAFIYIGNPYLNDYLKPNNQLFQFRIWSVKNTLVQNITYQPLIIEGDEYLHKNTEYHVKVRAKPNGKYFDGSWSEWSASLSFRTDAETNVQMLTYSLIVAIFDLLLQGQPLSFNPEVFSDLNIQPVELAGEQHVTAQPTDSDAQYLTEVKDQCLIQECDGDTKSCHSTSTGGSEAILLRCESPGEHLNFGAGSTDSNMCILDLKSDTESVETDDSDGNVGSEALGATQQDEVYVTMSSFYQIQ